MADRLTQLQDTLDELLMRMYASLSYIQTQAPNGEIAGQPNQAIQGDGEAKDNGRVVPITNGNTRASVDGVPIKTENSTPGPEMAASFTSALRELARDLVLQEQKTELLINSLPGLGNSERDQRLRMQELEQELREVETARARAEKDKTEMLRQLEQIIAGLGRVR